MIEKGSEGTEWPIKKINKVTLHLTVQSMDKWKHNGT